MGGMGTSCITTLTAFVVVNARRLGMHTFDVGLWATPIVVLGIGLTLWRRAYVRRRERET
jgi:cytochrome c-type biogenesis protein CcmH/NrfF